MSRPAMIVQILVFASLMILLSSCRTSFQTRALLTVESPLTLMDYKNPEHKIVLEPKETPYRITLHQHASRRFFSVETTEGEVIRIKLGSLNFASSKRKVFDVGQEWKIARKSFFEESKHSPLKKSKRQCLYGYRMKAYSSVINAGTPYSQHVTRYKKVPDYGIRLEEGYYTTQRSYYQAHLISETGDLLAKLSFLRSEKTVWKSLNILEKCHK